MMYSDSTLSVKDAAGRQISLLNDHQQIWQKQSTPASSLNGKRKYLCTESGCNKSFTTSGHLARHHRIHSGEKNFHCLHPGCPSRFSRQDNMMQHYRTHLSPKSRRYHQRHRQQSQQTSKNSGHPRLHCHTLVGSESEATTHPLTDIKAGGDLYASATAVTRARRSSTMPSSFHPYQQQSPTRNRHHGLSGSCSLVQPLFTSAKPLPMEPESASSPPLSTNMYPQLHQSSHRPQRAHSASSTSSSSSSFLSPRSPTLSPPPLIDQTDIIYPKNFIQLPPLQQEMHIGNQGQRVSDLIHTVSIFG